jgi:hypothetical protein
MFKHPRTLSLAEIAEMADTARLRRRRRPGLISAAIARVFPGATGSRTAFSNRHLHQAGHAR